MTGDGAHGGRDRDRALQQAIADACLGESAGGAIAHDLRRFLEDRHVHPDDVEAILAAPRRLGVYRALVRNGLSGVVLRMLPRTRTRMNAACGGRFDADLARFVDQRGPRTHYLRDVPAELFAWAEAEWRADARVPAYLPDLATHELTAFIVAGAEPAGPPADLGELGLDRRLAFAASTRLARYAWAVHELPDDDAATDPPAARDVRLLAYRDASGDGGARWLEMTPLAADLVEQLHAGGTLGSAVAQACARHQVAPDAVLGEIARLLSDLAERGVVLGGVEGASGREA